MRGPAALLLSLALVAVPLAGCGGDDSSGGSAAANDPDNSRERVLVEATDGKFNPQAIYDEVSDGVVTIISVLPEGGSLLGGEDGGGAVGQGSGFVINKNGEIATNAHVVADSEGKDAKPAKEVFVEFADRNRVKADVVGFDPNADVALLKVDPDGLDLVPLELSNGRGLSVGQPVAAIGSPFGERQSLSIGVISATGRSIESLTDFRIDDAIQTDAAINRGNSGGPLLDSEGRVIGLNQQIKSTSGGGEGVGFAVPVTAARRSIEQLRDGGKVDYPYIGVSSQSLYPQLADKLGIEAETGALIAEVVDGGPADKAGLKGGSKDEIFQGTEVREGGDVIIAINDEELVQENDLPKLISRHDPGDRVTLDIVRGGDKRQVEVTLGTRPKSVPGG